MNSGPTSASVRPVTTYEASAYLCNDQVLAPGNITGTFDSTTDLVVKDFQQSAGLTVDGIVGPITWQALPAIQYAAVSSWCVGQRCDRVTKGLKKSSLLRLIRALWMVTLAEDEAAVRAYQQDGVSKRTESSRPDVWAPAGAGGLLLPLFPDYDGVI